MGLETANYVGELVATNPDGGDNANTIDEHLRLIKLCLTQTFPNLDGEVSASAMALNRLIYAVRTNDAASISATQVWQVSPVFQYNGTKYKLGPAVGFSVVDTSPNPAVGSPSLWSATWAASGRLVVYHTLDATIDGGTLGVVAQVVGVPAVVYIPGGQVLSNQFTIVTTSIGLTSTNVALNILVRVN